MKKTESLKNFKTENKRKMEKNMSASHNQTKSLSDLGLNTLIYTRNGE